MMGLLGTVQFPPGLFNFVNPRALRFLNLRRGDGRGREIGGISYDPFFGFLLPFNIDGHGYLSFLWIQASLNCGHFFASLLQKYSLSISIQKQECK